MAANNTNERIVTLLAAADLFGDLSAGDLAQCAASFREFRFAKGEMLFARGDPGKYLYVIAEGQVRLAIATSEGRELSFEIAGPGTLFGEIALLDDSPRSAEATALAATTVYSLERSEFQRLRTANPAISEATIAFLCHRLRDVSSRLENIALFSLEVRVARFLLVALGEREAPPGRRVPLELNFSQSEFAQLVGASRPKLNGALAALESQGAIRRTADRLFCDREKLAAIAAGPANL